MIEFSLLQSTPAFIVALVLFVLMLIAYWMGHRIRSYMVSKSPGHAEIDLKSINGVILGLLALLLAFTFSMSNSRFDDRRHLAIEEANIIGTTILRADFYPDSVRKVLRRHLKDYLEERIAFYEAGSDWKNVVMHYRKAETIANEIWGVATAFAKTDSLTTIKSQFIPTLNEMIDIATSRRAAGVGTIPDSLMYFLLFLCICSSFMLGYDHKGNVDWIIVCWVSLTLSATVFMINDLDSPRSGLITMDAQHGIMVELRGMFAKE